MGRLPPGMQARLVRAIDSLARDPLAGDVKTLAGLSDVWRIRVGNYRILFALNPSDRSVTVTRIAHRPAVYRR